MKSLDDLNDELIAIFNGLKDGSIDADKAQGLNRIAGNIIRIANTKLHNCALRGERPAIPMLMSQAPVNEYPQLTQADKIRIAQEVFGNAVVKSLPDTTK